MFVYFFQLFYSVCSRCLVFYDRAVNGFYSALCQNLRETIGRGGGHSRVLQLYQFFSCHIKFWKFVAKEKEEKKNKLMSLFEVYLSLVHLSNSYVNYYFNSSYALKNMTSDIHN